MNSRADATAFVAVSLLDAGFQIGCHFLRCAKVLGNVVR